MSIFRLNGLIVQIGEGIARPAGQSSARWQVLGHARQSVQRIADALVKEGLVAYENHPTDQRTKLLSLTPQGMEVLKIIYTQQLEWSQHIMTKLDPNQVAETVHALQGIGQALEADMKERISSVKQ